MMLSVGRGNDEAFQIVGIPDEQCASKPKLICIN
jgi:hypothetical protein